MAIQEYVDCVSQVSSQSKEDLIEFFLNITKIQMRLSKKNNRKFCFFWFTIHYRSTRKKIKRDNERNNV